MRTLPPSVLAGGGQPAQAPEHVDRGDEPASLECRLGSLDHAPLEPLVAVGPHRRVEALDAKSK